MDTNKRYTCFTYKGIATWKDKKERIRSLGLL